MKKIEVMIADDHALMREGLKQLLGLDENLVITGLAAGGEETIELCKKLEPDVLLLDINMPVVNGIQALKRIKEMGLDVKVIMLTIHDDAQYLLETMSLGASGYLLKDVDADSLMMAIKKVYEGGTYIQPVLANHLVKGYGAMKDEKQILTNREYEVITLIAEGLNNKDIAETLFISEKTVKNHVSNIFKKINVTDRTQAAIYAFKHNIKKI
ncbi:MULTISPECIES: response regulator transcription factor [unclassified Fusibacter]|uniref:response regulator n=1 Tax=unclassified Fusibacter TaxID=2624464 RepID=UPI001010D048|nr:MULTISPECIES: response regulator transcription factor [unclassified Fusibacter]MCK8061011.1 response regulator transcription factor [Fusibacter sp. A2]NPE20535.1 response regulator transcription factor [Fusibacter sp. A1]RXV63733.1 DNA-binding response regulator [Fusibacter sp. A1]